MRFKDDIRQQYNTFLKKEFLTINSMKQQPKKVKCPTCDGSGKNGDKKCKKCNGTGQVNLLLD